MNRPVVYDRHGNVIVEDDDRRVIPDGARLICGVTMIDHNSIQPGEGKMTVIVDGKS